jgi:transcriptional regulator with XRE-family HTH domain
MPRPSKHVSPDTLGGRIRAARAQLHLSLADVARGHYSTSLLSQIERNRVEPSEESLRFLSERLSIPFEDLELLARQHRPPEVEVERYQDYEEIRNRASQLLAEKETTQALALLQDIHLPGLNGMQRWRIAALRGQCYFEQRKFLKAQQDLMYAASEQPRTKELSTEQRQEVMLLHLHLAATFRELQQFDEAQEHYEITSKLLSRKTPFGYVAEVHWGLAMISFAQANKEPQRLHHAKSYKETLLRSGLQHATDARCLYRAINDRLNEAAVTCQIAEIEQALGEVESARAHLEQVLAGLSSTVQEVSQLASINIRTDTRRQREEANVVCAAACELAELALKEERYEAANCYVELAIKASKLTYKLRRAEAYIMRGRILESINPYDPEAEKAFRMATEELASTQRISARISAHVRLGHHLLKIGKIDASERELEQARLLSDIVALTGPVIAVEDSALS